ncbi:cyclic nucleotide-binding domain-containing protein [Legionella sp. 27cVA30]|uniref:cyclic nucleotide-binding domain-containing protein n=1 Tax=Legionella sp. 27cVA30 TaxID=2905657 RepID=UPI00209F1086|nr:cyclic nucleotide-binding domain-containing protein [Legionella sp. 27cVA30]MCP0914777.1 cyclic nucleotide-binding domain-containing protein [Legionella sp. 27cVA30]
MQILTTDIIFVAGELVLILSFLCRDMLLLRMINALGQVIYITGAIIGGLNSPGMKVILLFGSIIILIHVKESIYLIRERSPISLPAAVKQTYQSHFYMMSAYDFLKIYKLGKLQFFKMDDVIAWQGTPLVKLCFLNTGEVEIIKDNRVVAHLQSGFFIGEMSFLKGGVANATVRVATVTAECLEWDREALNKLKKQNHNLYVKFEQAIAFNLIRKLDEGSAVVGK